MAPVDGHVLQAGGVDAPELPQDLRLDPFPRKDELGGAVPLAGEAGHQVLAGSGPDTEGKDPAPAAARRDQLQDFGLVADLAVGQDDDVETALARRVEHLRERLQDLGAAQIGPHPPHPVDGRVEGGLGKGLEAGKQPFVPGTEPEDLEPVSFRQGPQAQLDGPPRLVDRVAVHRPGAVDQDRHRPRGGPFPLGDFGKQLDQQVIAPVGFDGHGAGPVRLGGRELDDQVAVESGQPLPQGDPGAVPVELGAQGMRGRLDARMGAWASKDRSSDRP